MTIWNCTFRPYRKDVSRRIVNYRMSKAVHKRFREFADKNHVNMSATVEDMVVAYLDAAEASTETPTNSNKASRKKL